MKRSPLKRWPWLGVVIIAIAGLLVKGEPPKVAAIPATDAGKIAAAKGKSIAVSGRVAKANVSGSGTHFLNFDGSKFKAVCLKDLAKKFPSGGPASLYKDKNIVITGVVELYKGDPQIKLTSPDQVQVIGGKPNQSSAASSGEAKPFALKQLGATTWVSPFGLKYSGRDPQGKTRVEHIMRHAKDQPTRAGKHGVFMPGDRAAVFALIDEAWQKAENSGLRPKREGSRSVYNISMGRRVGFLGGREGARRGKPALKKLRIVFETGTKNIVTAFPS